MPIVESCVICLREDNIQGGDRHTGGDRNTVGMDIQGVGPHTIKEDSYTKKSVLLHRWESFRDLIIVTMISFWLSPQTRSTPRPTSVICLVNTKSFKYYFQISYLVWVTSRHLSAQFVSVKIMWSQCPWSVGICCAGPAFKQPAEAVLTTQSCVQHPSVNIAGLHQSSCQVRGINIELQGSTLF